MLGSVSRRGCLGAPWILPTTTDQRIAGALRHPRWRLSLSASPIISNETSVRYGQKSTTKSTNKVKNTPKTNSLSLLFLFDTYFWSLQVWGPNLQVFLGFFFQNLQICMWWALEGLYKSSRKYKHVYVHLTSEYPCHLLASHWISNCCYTSFFKADLPCKQRSLRSSQKGRDLSKKIEGTSARSQGKADQHK